MSEDKPILFWIGDAVAHTGFATVTHAVLDRLCEKWDVHVLGINHNGDAHDYKYKIYPANLSNGDLYGFKRVKDLLTKIKPDVLCVFNDPWIADVYVSLLGSFAKRTALYMPVDSPNLKSVFIEPLNEAHTAIAYTHFGKKELESAGLTIPCYVIPHGVDLTHFHPLPRTDVRHKLNMPEDWYIVLVVDRNQPRKRIDLAIEYFAEWSKDKPENVKFYYHGALQDIGWDVEQLCKYYGIDNRLILTARDLTPSEGIPRNLLKLIYNTANIKLSTTLGEGWGLTTHEAMACGIPCIVPDWSALGEWPEDAVIKVPCTTFASNTNGLNTIGGIADKQATLQALDLLYTDEALHDSLSKRSVKIATKEEFKWSSVAVKFDQIFTEILNEKGRIKDSNEKISIPSVEQ